MKNMNKVFASALLVTLMAGCTDASAKLKDNTSTLFTIGKTTVTKGQVYEMMRGSSGGSTAVNNSNRYIADKEIEVTDEMKESANGTLDLYKTYYGDSFTQYLEESGMTEEDYVNKNLIPGLQVDALPKKYVEENFDAVAETFKPYKATVLAFTSEDDANAALSELKDGSATPADAVANHNSTSSSDPKIYTNESTELDAMVRTALSGMKPDDGWTEIASSDGGTFYVLHMDAENAADFKDEAIESLASVENVRNDANTYWFKKYNFHIYDISVYNAVAADYPDYLVQNMK